jgi:hypothetical protein
MNLRSFVRAAAGGALSGVLATIPLLGLALNCLCCASVWGSAGGVVLWEWRSRGVVSKREGALLGLIAGVVSGLVAAAFIVLLTFDARQAAQMVREMSGAAEAREKAAALLESGAVTAATAIFTATLHAGVGALGGLASAALIASGRLRMRSNF